MPNLFLWFTANEIGDYHVFCAEYCGMSHSKMLTKVHVMSQEDFDAWLKTEGDKVAELQKATESGRGQSNLHILGEQLAKSKGCVACHSSDGSKLVGSVVQGRVRHEAETVVTAGAERRGHRRRRVHQAVDARADWRTS